MGKDILRMASNINQLRQQAYATYLPVVENLCSRDASEEELSHHLDYMLDFACDERMLELYKKLCRKYVPTYPDSIKYYVSAYREMWEDE